MSYKNMTPRSGFTIMEVMVAFMIVAVAAMSLIEVHAGLQRLREQSAENNQVMAVGRSIVNQIVAFESSDLGGPRASWAKPRFEKVYADITRAPLTVTLPTATPGEDSLNGPQAPVSEVVSVRNLKVYIEYYRGSKGAETAVPGLLNDPLFSGLTYADVDKFVERMRLNPAVVDSYRLITDVPASALAVDDMMIVRVILTWEELSTHVRRVVLFTAKRKES